MKLEAAEAVAREQEHPGQTGAHPSSTVRGDRLRAKRLLFIDLAGGLFPMALTVNPVFWLPNLVSASDTLSLLALAS
jgi:hypothetical protein